MAGEFTALPIEYVEWDEANIPTSPDGGGSGAAYFVIPCTDRLTPITSSGVGSLDEIADWMVPFDLTASSIHASLTKAAATGTFTVQVKRNGTAVLSTVLTIDATERNSVTAAVPAVISDFDWNHGDRITFGVTDDADGTATGLQMYITTGVLAADTESPSTPTGLGATVIDYQQIDLDCADSSDDIGVTAYQFQRATNAGFTTGLVSSTVSVSNISITGLTPSTTYYFRVRARDAAGNYSDWSTSTSGTTNAGLPQTNLKNDWEADTLDATLNDGDTITTVTNNITSGSSGTLTAGGAENVIFKTGQLNGHDSIRFANSGSGGYLSVATPSNFDQFTIVFIGRITVDTIASDGDAASRKIARSTSTSLYIRSNGSDENTVTGLSDLGVYSHIVIVHNNTDTKVYQNGALIGTFTPASGADWRLNLLGVEYVGGGTAGMDIVRWIEYNAALTGTPLTDLHNYLDSYCGF